MGTDQERYTVLLLCVLKWAKSVWQTAESLLQAASIETSYHENIAGPTTAWANGSRTY